MDKEEVHVKNRRDVSGYPAKHTSSPSSPANAPESSKSRFVSRPRWRRLIYWATLLAQFIIASVSATFIFYNAQVWPIIDVRTGDLDFLGFLNLLSFSLSSVLTEYNFLMAIFVGPGYVPENWAPAEKEDCKKLQYCSVCDAYKAPRSHHCRQCQRCVLKMEHHCPWINNCVGHRNHAYFLRFLFFAVIGCFHALLLFTVLFCKFFYTIYEPYDRYGSSPRSRRPARLTGLHGMWHNLMNSFHLPPALFNLSGLLWLVIEAGFAIGVVLAVGILFIIQLQIILKNETSIEKWIINKANYYSQEEKSEKGEQKFKNPYNLGWWKNFEQVIWNETYNPLGDGIWWPVIPSADQFTLTCEQLRQKQIKWELSTTYIAKGEYNGRKFPLFSQGCRVCISFPWTIDESRLVLKPGDVIRVSRFQKRWLYGVKVPSSMSDSVEISTLANPRMSEEKGWFPRRVVELKKE